MQEQETDPESIRFLKSLLYVGLFVTAAFVITYTVIGKSLLAIIVACICMAYSISLWFVHRGRYINIIPHFAVAASIVGILLSAYQDPVTAYWLPIVAVAAFVLMQKRGMPWVLALFFGISVFLFADEARAHPFYSIDAGLNLAFSYITAVIMCYMFIIRIESKQREVAEYAERLASEKLGREKLELARTLAGGIAHLVNNEMQTIVSKSYLLKKRVPDKVVSDIDLLQGSAMQASSHIKQLLAYAEGSHLPLQRVEMRALLEEVAEAWQQRLPQQIDLQVKLGKGSPICHGDREELRQLLNGLLENAVEACGENGNITLTMKKRHIDEHEQGNDLKSGDYVRIMVKDNGHGMSEEVMGHIFEPFYSTRFAGRGLGLSAIFGIVNYHGGRIIAESKEEKGSTFSIWWPLASEPESHASDE